MDDLGYQKGRIVVLFHITYLPLALSRALVSDILITKGEYCIWLQKQTDFWKQVAEETEEKEIKNLNLLLYSKVNCWILQASRSHAIKTL